MKKTCNYVVGGGSNRGRGAKVNTGPRMDKKKQAPLAESLTNYNVGSSLSTFSFNLTNSSKSILINSTIQKLT